LPKFHKGVSFAPLAAAGVLLNIAAQQIDLLGVCTKRATLAVRPYIKTRGGRHTVGLIALALPCTRTLASAKNKPPDKDQYQFVVHKVLTTNGSQYCIAALW